MRRDSEGNLVGAFPVSAGVFVGTAADQKCNGQILHFVDDGTCTFKFKGYPDVAIVGKAGFDVVVDRECTGVTSTAAVMIG